MTTTDTQAATDPIDLEVAETLADAFRKALVRFNLAEIGFILGGELRGMAILIADQPDPDYHPAAVGYREAGKEVWKSLEEIGQRNGV